MKCRECGCELSELCPDCEEKLLSEAISKLNKEKQKNARKGIVVFEDDPMYKAILERRDLEARQIK